ncbi:S-phase kinase-associated protein 2 [Armadillidium vulgare]|nr:S-phase kinase-associated protein 2 [Armadillidium vulgare]
MAAIEPEALAELLSVCYHLKKVSLEHCTVSTECCRYLSQNKELDTLNMAMCYDLNSEGLLEIFNKTSNLQSLNLAWTNLSLEDLNQICGNFPSSLLRLNLSGCRNTLIDSHIRQITLAAPSLLELDVSEASQLTSTSVAIVIRKLKKLEYLAFSRCFKITPSAYLELKSMKNLLYLDVYGILDDRDLATVRDNLPNIKVNKYLFSSVARPTVGVRRTSIWGVRVRD